MAPQAVGLAGRIQLHEEDIDTAILHHQAGGGIGQENGDMAENVVLGRPLRAQALHERDSGARQRDGGVRHGSGLHHR